ncbi:hypothetical protein M430DRAFT_154191 [Amorphotheca resinae ATCC 22711]|uniref:Uncharacterized protein n=1 Tax=Amorphotheca resinae ATCC 22711 TaxID=857342 RepID=A0A2T3BDN0_AMORE|nr:hypothetical protein M430DRAFT_154191 [Amorphotheca resinae ATCC 22711]PSS27438.1 hypothetical protein M430DRAFT_154191 [Amorphotheca resinae ATCC 22711]
MRISRDEGIPARDVNCATFLFFLCIFDFSSCVYTYIYFISFWKKRRYNPFLKGRKSPGCQSSLHSLPSRSPGPQANNRVRKVLAQEHIPHDSFPADTIRRFVKWLDSPSTLL